MYGCGIGPINRAANRRMAAKTIDASVDRITLRDDNSRALLSEMGVVHPDICVSADPTIILTPAPHEIVNLALEKCGIDPDGSYIGFGLRNWKGLDDALPEIAAAADYAYEKHGLTPVFVPIEFPSDLMPAERVGALLHCPWHAVRIRQPIETTIGILARMKTVVGIRLHSLMFSAGQGRAGRRHELRHQGGRLPQVYRQPDLPSALVRPSRRAVPPDRRVRFGRARQRGAPHGGNAARQGTGKRKGGQPRCSVCPGLTSDRQSVFSSRLNNQKGYDMKNHVVCLSTTNYHPLPTRKQNVMSRLRNSEVLYFDPPVSIIAPLKDKKASAYISKYRQPGEKVEGHENITVYALPPVLPFFNLSSAG